MLINFDHMSCLDKIVQCLIESETYINYDDYVFKLRFQFADFEE